MIVENTRPPYYAVIFTFIPSDQNEGYTEMSAHLTAEAHLQDGFLGEETVRGEMGVSVSYWRDETAVRNWKLHAQHRIAQEKGKKGWYLDYRVRVAKVEREYSMEK